jgi:hypothetical protein
MEQTNNRQPQDQEHLRKAEAVRLEQKPPARTHQSRDPRGLHAGLVLDLDPDRCQVKRVLSVRRFHAVLKIARFVREIWTRRRSIPTVALQMCRCQAVV